MKPSAWRGQSFWLRKTAYFHRQSRDDGCPIIILDEATANVDPESEQELIVAIEALTKEKAILMIAHRLKTVRQADQILVIDGGKIVQSGTHEQLMQQKGIYHRFVESRELAVGWKI